jgi:hypothetical protein
VRRRILADLPDQLGHELAVYGYGWEPELLDPAHLRGDHVPNDELPAYYSGAEVVLNDHWDAMRELAFPSNRLYDASACAATVVSDHVDGLDELFEGAVTTYRDRAELATVLDSCWPTRVAAGSSASAPARWSSTGTPSTTASPRCWGRWLPGEATVVADGDGH